MANHEQAFWETSSLDEHLSLMRRQVSRSLAEGQIRTLTRKVMRGVPDDTEWTLRGRVPVVRAWDHAFSMANVKAAKAGSSAACSLIPIWNFVCNNVQYEKDPPDYDLFQTAEVSLCRGAGDCDDSTIVLATMIRASGIDAEPYARVISVDGQRWSHVYTVAKFAGQAIALDPTVRGATLGWEYQGAKTVRDFRM